jgi:hypothetical protein
MGPILYCSRLSDVAAVKSAIVVNYILGLELEVNPFEHYEGALSDH